MLLRCLLLVLLGWTCIGFALPTADYSRERSGWSSVNERWDANNTIVVGGGTAGLVVAKRLSETARVVVVEAGIDYLADPSVSETVNIPALDVIGAGADRDAASNILSVDWAFATTPQKNAGNRSIHYERGKMLGGATFLATLKSKVDLRRIVANHSGSSSRNFMIYQRGSKHSYDIWAKWNGPEWSFHRLLPYFEKVLSTSSVAVDRRLCRNDEQSINYRQPNNSLRMLSTPTPSDPALMDCTYKASEDLQTASNVNLVNSEESTRQVPFGKGPLALSVAPFAQAFGPFMIGALRELGLRVIDSFNGGSILGVQFCVSSIEQTSGRVERSTSRSAFLDNPPILETEEHLNGDGGGGSLLVLTGAMAQRILFDGKENRAIGIRYTQDGAGCSSLDSTDAQANFAEEKALYATREVILSAGAFQSPQLLMVSGIGPKHILKQHKIKPLVHLEGVGQGMEDHVFFGPTYPVDVQSFSRIVDNATFELEQLRNFSVSGLGPFTNPLADTIAFERLNKDLLATIGAEKLDELPQDWPHLEYIISPGFPGNFSVLTGNPSTPPRPVGQQYATILAAIVAPQSRGTVSLSSPSMCDPPVIDPNYLHSKVDQAVAIAGFRRTRQAFSTSFMGQILDGEEIYPGPSVSTTADILDFVKNNLMTVWHASCTCSMRPRELGGVLDSRLRVYGTKGLRVVDTSSFPALPPGHPQSTVYALAEKAAHLIKEDHLKYA